MLDTKTIQFALKQLKQKKTQVYNVPHLPRGVSH